MIRAIDCIDTTMRISWRGQAGATCFTSRDIRLCRQARGGVVTWVEVIAGGGEGSFRFDASGKCLCDVGRHTVTADIGSDRVHAFGCTKSRALGGPGTPGACWCESDPLTEHDSNGQA